MKGTMIALRKAQKEVKELREECEALAAHNKRQHAQLVKATEWVYKYSPHIAEKYDEHVWGDEE
jgi:hypothetical protein